MTKSLSETLSRLQGQFLGTGIRLPWMHSDETFNYVWIEHSDLPPTIQYEIDGPGGGTWHLDLMARQVASGPAREPGLILQCTTDDWLGLWAGSLSVWTLLDADRIVRTGPFSDEVLLVADLVHLGALGPIPAPSTGPYQVMSGTQPDHARYRFFSSRRGFCLRLARIHLGMLRDLRGIESWAPLAPLLLPVARARSVLLTLSRLW